jgi:hypothetical protein
MTGLEVPIAHAVIEQDPGIARHDTRTETAVDAKSGKFVGQFNVDAGQGGAFGIRIAMVGYDTARLAVVDDNVNDIIVIDQNVEPGE